MKEILLEDPKSKTMAVVGHFAESADSAVILAEKTPLSAASLPELFSPNSKTSVNTQNNIYSQIEVSCGGSIGNLRVMSVYPATQAHISKYSQQRMHIVQETPQDYTSITKPFIEAQSFSIEVSSFFLLLYPSLFLYVEFLLQEACNFH